MHRLRLLSSLPKFAVGMEIGVWKGDFSREILDYLNPEHLYLVDPWIYQPFSTDGKDCYSARWYGGSIAKSQEDMDKIYADVVGEFDQYENVTILRSFSSEIKQSIPAETLDWTYIDGNHSYEYVLNDMEISFDILKSKGIIAGDDFDNSSEIRLAVNDFHMKYKNQISSLETFDGQFLLKIDKK